MSLLAPSEETLARRAVGIQVLIGPGLLVVLFLFPVVLFIPLLSTRLLFFSSTKLTLAGAACGLLATDRFLFAIVFVFGIVIPAVKTVLSVLCWYRLSAHTTKSLISTLTILSKLSMLDVMLFAIFVVLFKGIGVGAIRIHFGLYLYSSLILVSLILNIAMTTVLNRDD